MRFSLLSHVINEAAIPYATMGIWTFGIGAAAWRWAERYRYVITGATSAMIVGVWLMAVNVPGVLHWPESEQTKAEKEQLELQEEQAAEAQKGVQEKEQSEQLKEHVKVQKEQLEVQKEQLALQRAERQKIPVAPHKPHKHHKHHHHHHHHHPLQRVQKRVKPSVRQKILFHRSSITPLSRLPQKY